VRLFNVNVRTVTRPIHVLGTLLAPALAPITGLLAGAGICVSVVICFVGFFAHPVQDFNRLRYLAADLQVRAISKALEHYRADCGDYPLASSGLAVLLFNPGVDGWKGPYLKHLPVDPWQRPYRYSRPLASALPEVLSLGANQQPGGELFDADISSLRPRQPFPESPIETRSRRISLIIWTGAWTYLITSVVVLTRTPRRSGTK
jgi:type II secretion system protein G